MGIGNRQGKSSRKGYNTMNSDHLLPIRNKRAKPGQN